MDQNAIFQLESTIKMSWFGFADEGEDLNTKFLLVERKIFLCFVFWQSSDHPLQSMEEEKSQTPKHENVQKVQHDMMCFAHSLWVTLNFKQKLSEAP